MNVITLNRGDEAVRVDEAHDQFGDLPSTRRYR
jgi:hypothetical protein